MKIEPPPHVESRRARVIVDAEGKKLLSVCVRCHLEKYILEDYTTCSDCRPEAQVTAVIRWQSRKPSAK